MILVERQHLPLDMRVALVASAFIGQIPGHIPGICPMKEWRWLNRPSDAFEVAAVEQRLHGLGGHVGFHLRVSRDPAAA